MTVIERIAECKKCTDFNADTVEKLIALAYYIGREEATREISDKYNAVFKDQKVRANNYLSAKRIVAILSEKKKEIEEE